MSLPWSTTFYVPWIKWVPLKCCCISESPKWKKVLLVCSNPFRIIPMLVPSFAAVSGMCLKEEGSAPKWMEQILCGLLSVRPPWNFLRSLFSPKRWNLSLFLFPLLSHIEGQLGLDSWKLEGKTSNADRHQLKGVENLLSSSPVRNRQVTYSLTLKQDQDGVANYWKYICYGI